MINKEETRSRDMETEAAIIKIEEISDVKEILNFVDGETRKGILNVVNKRLLRLRGGVSCEDVLENLRAKGYKV